MTSKPRVRVYIACSLDGFIAGKGDDLSWLPGADPNQRTSEPFSSALPAEEQRSDAGSIEYDAFMRGVGALLIGRRTYDVVLGFGGEWPFGKRPVLVATHRPLKASTPDVEPVGGTIEEMVETALTRAAGADVYLDGGNLIRQALDAGLVDDLVVTVVPVLLGEGHSLFAGVTQRHQLEFTGHYRYGESMVQLHARPARSY